MPGVDSDQNLYQGSQAEVAGQDQVLEPGLEGEPTGENPWTKTDAPHTISKALDQLADLVNQEIREGHVTWIPAEGSDSSDLERLTSFEMVADASRLAEWMKNKAGIGPEGVAEINKFLEENGFSIRLRTDVRDDELAAASIFQFTDKWDRKHRVEEVGGGIRLANSEEVVPGFKALDVVVARLREGQVYRMVTESQARSQTDGVFVMPMSEATDRNLQEMAAEIMKQYSREAQRDGGRGRKVNLSVPMVDIQRSGNIDSIMGAQVAIDDTPVDARITQALYEHIVQMSERGFSAKAAAVATATRFAAGMGNQEVTINTPYLLFLVNNGVVSFAAHVQPEDMRRPEIVGLEE